MMENETFTSYFSILRIKINHKFSTFSFIYVLCTLTSINLLGTVASSSLTVDEGL